MKNAFDRKLQLSLCNLPDYAPCKNIWDKVVQKIDIDEQVSTSVDSLPDYTPEFNLWDTIDSKLTEIETQDKQTNNNNSKYIIQLMVAASLAIVIVRTIIINQEKSINLRVETELVYSEGINFTNKEDNEIISEIEKICSLGKEVCSTGVFEEKIALYYELTNELNELNEVINNLGESPEIIQSVQKIELMKSDTIHELLAMVNP